MVVAFETLSPINCPQIPPWLNWALWTVFLSSFVFYCLSVFVQTAVHFPLNHVQPGESSTFYVQLGRRKSFRNKQQHTNEDLFSLTLYQCSPCVWRSSRRILGGFRDQLTRRCRRCRWPHRSCRSTAHRWTCPLDYCLWRCKSCWARQTGRPSRCRNSEEADVADHCSLR